MDVSCQCGAITFRTPSAKPLALYICHCTECRRQTGAAFGCSAIFPRFPLPTSFVKGALSRYARPTPSGILSAYFCTKCGTRLVHSTEGKSIVVVKAGCIDGLDWSIAKHIWANRAVMPLPEGAEYYDEEPGYEGFDLSGLGIGDTGGVVKMHDSKGRRIVLKKIGKATMPEDKASKPRLRHKSTAVLSNMTVADGVQPASKTTALNDVSGSELRQRHKSTGAHSNMTVVGGVQPVSKTTALNDISDSELRQRHKSTGALPTKTIADRVQPTTKRTDFDNVGDTAIAKKVTTAYNKSATSATPNEVDIVKSTRPAERPTSVPISKITPATGSRTMSLDAVKTIAAADPYNTYLINSGEAPLVQEGTEEPGNEGHSSLQHGEGGASSKAKSTWVSRMGMRGLKKSSLDVGTKPKLNKSASDAGKKSTARKNPNNRGNVGRGSVGTGSKAGSRGWDAFTECGSQWR